MRSRHLTPAQSAKLYLAVIRDRRRERARAVGSWIVQFICGAVAGVVYAALLIIFGCVFGLVVVGMFR